MSCCVLGTETQIPVSGFSDPEKNCQILFLSFRSRSCFSDPEKNCQILFLSFKFRSCFSDPEKSCQILFLSFRFRFYFSDPEKLTVSETEQILNGHSSSTKNCKKPIPEEITSACTTHCRYQAELVIQSVRQSRF